jgi:hypothetical protein
MSITAMVVITVVGMIGGGIGGVVAQVLLRKARRDYFAGHAMAARMIAIGAHHHNTADEEAACDAQCAEAAYRKADAMLAERDK